MYLENENIRDLAGLQVQVTVMASYGIISLRDILEICVNTTFQRRANVHLQQKAMAACADGSDKNCNAKLQLSPVFTTGPPFDVW